MQQGYDLIGDVHGCGETLILLLEQMGYRKINGVFQHKSRKVVFLGDIIDRGPHIRLACDIVRNMVEAGSAHMIMGNHEYNAVTYMTPAPAGVDRPYLRPHSERNNFIVQQTVEQFANYPQELKDYLDWFTELPLFLEFDHFRVVHACWDQTLINEFIGRFGGNQLHRGLLSESVNPDTFLFQFLDRILRGTSLKLPNNRSMTAKDGMVRQFFRTKFWSQNPQVYNDVVFQPDPLPVDLSHASLSAAEKEKLLYYSETEKPLFFGHYWMSGVPSTIRDNIACLDYSAVKYGRLVAYRMDNEKQLNNGKFTWVRVDKSEQ
jgi:hypothetical protein